MWTWSDQSRPGDSQAGGNDSNRNRAQAIGTADRGRSDSAWHRHRDSTQLGLIRLTRSGFIEAYEDNDYNDNTFVAYRLTGQGADWLLDNQDLGPEPYTGTRTPGFRPAPGRPHRSAPGQHLLA